MSVVDSNHSSYVWIAAGLGLTAYATAGVLLTDIPGIQELTAWLSSLSGWWILLAAFIAMFLEGLYFIGSFFPGTSVVILLAILSGAVSWGLFLALLITIFISWVLAGVVNIVLARQFASFRATKATAEVESDRMIETWFPAFRANHEVAQIVSGVRPLSVLMSSVRVKLFGMLIFIFHGAIMPLFIDVTEVSNKEGFAGLYVFAIIMIGVGWYQMKSGKNLLTGE